MHLRELFGPCQPPPPLCTAVGKKKSSTRPSTFLFEDFGSTKSFKKGIHSMSYNVGDFGHMRKLPLLPPTDACRAFASTQKSL
jgi:hypothetical protein